MSLFEDMSIEEFKLLIKENPKLVHEVNERGETPLFVQTNLEYVVALIENGANVLHQNKDGDTVLHQSGNKDECIEYLLRTDFSGIKNKEGDIVYDMAEIENFLEKEKYVVYEK